MNYTNSANPNTVLNWPSSYSTWVAITGSRVLVAYNSSDSNFNLGDSGGTATVATHSHQWYNYYTTSDGNLIQTNNISGTAKSSGWLEDGKAESFGDPLTNNYFTDTDIYNASANSNYPPYQVAAMWRRTA